VKIKMLKDSIVAPRGSVLEAKLSPEWCWSAGLGYHAKDIYGHDKVVYAKDALVVETNKYDICPRCNEQSLQFTMDGLYHHCCNPNCDYEKEDNIEHTN
jgi:hypothetical protein